MAQIGDGKMAQVVNGCAEPAGIPGFRYSAPPSGIHRPESRHATAA